MKITSLVLALPAFAFANLGIGGDAGSLKDPVDQGPEFVDQDEVDYQPGQDYDYKPGQDYDYKPGQDYDYKPGQDYDYRSGQDYQMRRFDCSSRGFGLERCYLGRGFASNRIRLLDQHSDSACIRGSTWGVRGDYVWVNRGCRGTFGLY